MIPSFRPRFSWFNSSVPGSVVSIQQFPFQLVQFIRPWFNWFNSSVPGSVVSFHPSQVQLFQFIFLGSVGSIHPSLVQLVQFIRPWFSRFNSSVPGSVCLIHPSQVQLFHFICPWFSWFNSSVPGSVQFNLAFIYFPGEVAPPPFKKKELFLFVSNNLYFTSSMDTKNYTERFEYLPQTLIFFLYIFATNCRRPLIFQLKHCIRSNNLCLPSWCKDKGILCS